MGDARVQSAAAAAPWLEIIEADSPVLLIAPHGGAAGARAHAKLHPKVNDLHTAAITRELAARTGACALINSGMDRNQLDCNRIPQLAEHAPWMLELVAERLARIVDRYGRATVLLIHGWNIIEPRVDFGLGLRRHGDELRPPASAHVSARDEFIHGPLSELAARLRESGIQPTWGMRYPAGGVHNLVQAFTGRHRDSTIAPLRQIARISALGAVDAAQLELSVAVRMPGKLRERCLEALVSVFRPGSDRIRPAARPAARVVRAAVPRTAAPARVASAPARVGIEFFDPAASVGGMASFDLGAGGTGARIMMLLGYRRVALFTAEGRSQISGTRVALGPLAIEISGGELKFCFSGPAVIVPDGAAYLSIERALASGRLDPDVRIEASMPIDTDGFDFAAIAAGASQPAPSPLAAFATLEGEVRAEGFAGTVHAAARAGLSFTGLGPQQFRARRMIWVRFGDGSPSALEFRSTTGDAGPRNLTARVLMGREWQSADLASLAIDAPSPEQPPPRIEASFATNAGGRSTISGRVAAFIPLSRPGPNQSRIYTSLGFAKFDCGGRAGTGMFEFSRRHDAPAESDDAEDGPESNPS
jgi:hypothetical protein